MRLELVSQGVESTMVPTEYGESHMSVFHSEDGVEHVCVVLGDVSGQSEVLVRIHSACATGELFGSLKCDCGQQLHLAMEAMQREGRGVLLYMNQEGRGIGLANKLRAYALQDHGYDTVEANEIINAPPDARHYDHAIDILRDLGIDRVNLMTNNPTKLDK